MIFANSRSFYTSDGTQHVSGQYLALVTPDDWTPGNPELRYFIRRCAMHQLGQFMMGIVRIGQRSVSVSGAFGNDGLPMDAKDLPPSWYERLDHVPPEAADSYWHGQDGDRALFDAWVKSLRYHR